MSLHQSISGELIISRHQGGVRLLPPGHSEVHTALTLEKLYQSACGIYFMDADYQGVSCNAACADMNGLVSENDLLGRTSFDIYKRASAIEQQHDDSRARKLQSLIVAGQTATQLSNDVMDFLTFKQPWYLEDKIVGVLGMTIKIDPDNVNHFAQRLSELISTGLIQSDQTLQLARRPDKNNKLTYFTPRELAVLKQLVRGRTAKDIGLILNLSKRTVENHIARMKDKSGCGSKFELIDKYFDSM